MRATTALVKSAAISTASGASLGRSRSFRSSWTRIAWAIFQRRTGVRQATATIESLVQ